VGTKLLLRRKARPRRCADRSAQAGPSSRRPGGLSHAVAATSVALSLAGCNVGPQVFEYHGPEGKPTPINLAPVLTVVFVAPLETAIGARITLSADAKNAPGDAMSFKWEGGGGTIADPGAANTTYTCKAEGRHDLAVSVTTKHGSAALGVTVSCVKGD